MAAKERLSEDIKYLIELLRLIWLSLIALGSGTIRVVTGRSNHRPDAVCWSRDYAERSLDWRHHPLAQADQAPDCPTDGGGKMETLAIVMGLVVFALFGYAVWIVTH